MDEQPVPAEDLAAKLERSLQTTWNSTVMEYPTDRFPFDQWMLERIQGMGYDLDDLRNLHEVIDDSKVYKVSKALCEATNEPSFRRLVHRFVREEVAVKGELEGPLAVQRFLNVRIMLPNKPQATFPFHTGLLYGHGPGSRSIWMPLTDVSTDEFSTASMHVIDTDTSREMIKEAADRKLSVEEMSEFFAGPSRQVRAGPGSCCLFNQETIHGNFVNETGKTRVSIDFRVAEAQFGDKLCRKIPGGYFQIIPDTEEEEERQERESVEAAPNLFNGKSNILYLNNATTATDGVPVHLQRYMVHDYCGKHDLNYEFEFFELEAMEHLPTLQYIVGKLACNVIAYSVYALPEDRSFRSKIIDEALRGGAVMHFVNEDLIIAGQSDKEAVEAVLRFAKFGDYAPAS